MFCQFMPETGIISQQIFLHFQNFFGLFIKSLDIDRVMLFQETRLFSLHLIIKEINI